MKKRSVLLFFFLPFLGVLVFFALSSVLTQADLKRRTSSLVRDQLTAASGILRTTVSHLLDEGRSPEEALETVLTDEDMYFTALLDEKKDVAAWNSRFEGYLPIPLRKAREGETMLIDSPAGKILIVVSAVPVPDGRRYLLCLGYALGGMEEMLALSRRSSFLIAGLILLAGALFFQGLFRLQTRYVDKAREAEAERQEKERFREISAFTSGVAHEIKNPLNSLALLLEMLERKSPPETREDLELGKDQVRTIAGIVDRFSRVVKTVRPAFEPLLLDELLLQTADSLTAGCPDAAGRIRIEAAPEVRFQGDRDLLGQALLNLMRNSVEASEDAGIVVSGARKGRKVEIVVRDGGPGLPEEVRGRIFEPFFTTKGTGMGIGLYLTRKMIEAHGGTIEALVPSEGGTEFRITLPGE